MKAAVATALQVEMTHESLARKYRPQSFDEIIGQGAIVQTLRNALNGKKLHPAYIFSGIRGVGKTTIARIVAKGINCTAGPTSRPCDACPSCIEVKKGRSMDVLEIDGASNNKVEEARDLTQLARYTPARDHYRVFIIDEVHMLSTAAFNALLKTLEEPPPNVVFLLATTEPHKIPETIHSRAQHFEFRRVPLSLVRGFLEGVCKAEGIEAEPAVLELLARAGDGSVRDSLTLLDRLIAYADGPVTEKSASEILGVVGRDVLFNTIGAIASADARRVLQITGELLDRGQDIKRYLQDLSEHAKRLLRERSAHPEAPGGEQPDLTERYRRQAEAFSVEDLFRLQDLILLTTQRLNQAPNPDTLLELQLLKAAHLPKILPLDQLLSAGVLGWKTEMGPERPRLSTTGNNTVPPLARESPQPAMAKLDVEKEPVPKIDKGVSRVTDESSQPDLAQLRFTSLIAFQRMDSQEAESYEGRDPRLEKFRLAVAKEFPLAGGAIEDANISVDPEGVLHLALPKSASAGLALLGTPERRQVLGQFAKEFGFSGEVVLEKGEGDYTDQPQKLLVERPVRKNSNDDGSPAIASVIKVLGAQLMGINTVQEKQTGDKNGEPE